jgi:hypothetical protein
MNCLPAQTAQRPRWRANGATLLQGLAQCAIGVAGAACSPHERPASARSRVRWGVHPGYACGEGVVRQFNASG